MAGGTWTGQNKKQPGVYVNVQSRMRQSVNIGERGVVAICEPQSWGPEGVIETVYAGDDFTTMTGYDQTHEKTLFLREIFKGSDHTNAPVKVLLYRPAGVGAAKAAAVSGALTVTAKYSGTRGNDIGISLMANPESKTFTVQTVVDGMVKDRQEAETAETLKSNDWVVFSGTGSLAAEVGITLDGGVNGDVTAAAYAEFLKVLEPYAFNILVYSGSDITVQGAYVTFVKRMREGFGKKCQVVLANAKSNSEAVISVHNGVTLEDGTIITPGCAAWWVGGVQAGANYNQSLVYAQYPGAADAFPRLTNAEIEEALEMGQIIFFEEFGEVKIMSDINTLTGYTPDKGEAFCLNQIIRIIDAIANDVYKYFSRSIIGKVQNNVVGRDVLKAWIVGYLNEMQANGGLKNFEADDVEVLQGDAINAVTVNLSVQPVAAIEKIYITVTLTDE